MRLDKFLADAGEGSRSEVKALIAKGRILVNGVTVKDPGAKLAEGDTVTREGRRIERREHHYYMLNKPAGVVSATEDAADKTVLDLFPDKLKRKLFPVGRLDKDTVGLLLLTDDGELAHALLSPVKHVDKRYLAVLDRPAEAEDVMRFAKGLTLADGTQCRAAELILHTDDPCRAEVILCEGKYHQVKRMFAACGKKVIFLKRLSMGSLLLDEELKEGEWRELTPEEERLLRQ